MPILRTTEADLHYLEAGHGEPVLLLHGLGSAAADWEPQIRELCHGYRVIALDARGSGASRDRLRPRGPFSVARFAADAAHLLDHLGAAPAHVVGLSMGGMIAFQLAVDHPRHLRTLTIVNSGPAMVPENAGEAWALATRSVLTTFLPPRHIATLIAPRLFPSSEQATLRAQFVERVAANDPHAYRATLRAIVGWSVADRLGSIHTPALVVAAEHDYTPVARKEAYVRRMPNARLVVVPGTHHALPIEAPAAFNRVLLAFLRQHATAQPRPEGDPPRPA
jgi:3-oxoadipate enol-lactonase